MSNRKRSLEADLPSMMYGYGDAKRVDAASVKLVEAMVRAVLRLMRMRRAKRVPCCSFCVVFIELMLVRVLCFDYSYTVAGHKRFLGGGTLA